MLFHIIASINLILGLEHLKLNLVVEGRVLSLITLIILMKLYYGSVLNKENIIDKLAIKVWKWMYVEINSYFFKFFHGKTILIWDSYCSRSTSYFGRYRILLKTKLLSVGIKNKNLIINFLGIAFRDTEFKCF